MVQSGLAPPGTTTKQLQVNAPKATDVANVFGQDLGGVTNAVGQLMRTGLVKNSSEAFDLITAGFQRGADRGGDFLDTITGSSVNLKQFGFTSSHAVGVFTQALNAGAPNADAFTGALEEMIGNASDGIETFHKLGLGGEDFADKLAGGGPKAATALDQLLDRIRKIQSPAERSAVLVELSGEEATALQSAILAVDPSSASQKLGTFAGTTKGLGETLRSGPSYEIQRFTRALRQGFIDFLGGKVLPIVTRAGQWFNTYLLPPIAAVARVVATVLVASLSGLLRAGRATVNWLRSMGAWLIPIAVAVGGLTLAITAQRIAVLLTCAVFKAYRAAILAWTAVQRAATIAILAVGRAIGSWFSGPFVRFFTQTIPGAFRTVLNWVKSN